MATARKAAEGAAAAREAAAREVTDLHTRLASAEEQERAAAQELEKSRRRLSNAAFPAASGGRARFLVEVPTPEARLFIDDKPYEGGEGNLIREFVTSRLERGKRYFVDLRVEQTIDGKTASAAKRVVFEPDTEQRVSFPVLEAGPSGGG